MKTICYANTIDYDAPLQQRPHHIMNELANRGYNILWVNQTQSPDIFRTKISDNLSVYHNWQRFLTKFKDKVDIYFSSWSHRHVDIAQLNPKKVIYDSLDLFPANESQEIHMVNKADIILTTTKGLYDYHKQHTVKPIYMCENGCFPKYRHVSLSIPAELKELMENNIPILLFSGALAVHPTGGWCDLDLLRQITRKYYMVCVGQGWGISNDFVKYHNDVFSKVIIVGNKDYDTLQRYYAHCTINLLPFKRCQTSDYSFPLKVIEGCNHGKICVATDIPVMQELGAKYPNALLVSKSHEEFMRNIKSAIGRCDKDLIKQECYQLADEYSWDKKVDIIEKVIMT